MAQKYESVKQVAARLESASVKKRKKTFTPRTITIWCSLGYFPGAKKVKVLTGQEVWRIPAGAVPIKFKKD